MAKGERTLRSTERDVKDFLKHPVWLDLMDELVDWEKDVQGIQDTSESAIDLYKCQGRKEALANFQALPSVLIDSFQEAERAATRREEEK